MGLVNRVLFLTRFCQHHVSEICGRRPITALANAHPLVVDESTPIGVLESQVTDRPDALREGFIVTRAGRYLGIGSGEGLLRAKIALFKAREAELRFAQQSAQQAHRSKTNFLALMSHELRTPLNAIIGFSEVLAQEMLGPHSSERYLVYARDIHASGQQLLTLVDNVLELSEAEGHYLELYPEAVDVIALMQNCVRTMSTRSNERRLRVMARASQDLPLLCADAGRVKQAVLNILSNAVKFTQPGGEVKLHAGLDPEGGITISVTDTGIGMSAEQIPIALEPFRQIESPMSRRYAEGSGLGLSLTKAFVEHHGGVLEIESAQGSGTKVRLRFPPERTMREEE
ncbi:MAG TPA: ATP-binding protein [Rhizomicrobium sp.]|nr:ATP-binding protein [Rhizomicrobium sp.]